MNNVEPKNQSSLNASDLLQSQISSQENQSIEVTAQGRTIRTLSSTDVMQKEIPWKKVGVAAFALFSIGLAVYAATQTDFSSNFQLAINQTSIDESMRKLFQEYTQKAFEFCSNSSIPSNFKEFESMHQQFTIDQNTYPPIVGDAAENIRQCTLNCNSIGWISEICREKLNTFNSFVSDITLNPGVNKKILEHGFQYPQYLDTPEIKVSYFKTYLLPMISQRFADLLPSNIVFSRYMGS